MSTSHMKHAYIEGGMDAGMSQMSTGMHEFMERIEHERVVIALKEERARASMQRVQALIQELALAREERLRELEALL